jgi:hypothetical protein
MEPRGNLEGGVTDIKMRNVIVARSGMETTDAPSRTHALCHLLSRLCAYRDKRSIKDTSSHLLFRNILHSVQGFQGPIVCFRSEGIHKVTQLKSVSHNWKSAACLKLPIKLAPTQDNMASQRVIPYLSLLNTGCQLLLALASSINSCLDPVTGLPMQLNSTLQSCLTERYSGVSTRNGWRVADTC